MNDGSVTFSWFIKNRFLLLKEAAWKAETAKTKTILIQRDLIEPIGEIPLVNFDKFSLQLHLNKLATTGSKDRVLEMRAYLRDIFAEAVDQDFLVKDDFIFANEAGGFPRHGQLSQAGSPQTRSRSQVAKADLPGHSQNDRNLSSKEGHGKGRAGCHAAFSYGHHDGCIHAGNSGKCAIDDQFHQPRIARFSG